jgi:hypothetical protein
MGGGSRTGMLKYNDLYEQVKKDGLEDNGADDREYIAHYVEKSKNKRKRRCDNGGQLRSLTVSDGIGDLLGLPWRPKMMEQQEDLLRQCNNNMETIDNTIMLRNSKP